MPDFIRGVYGLPDSGLQNSPVDIPVKILEHVENHPAYGGAFVRVKVFLNGIHRNFRSPFVGEMELSGRDAAERDAPEAVLTGAFEA